ncbi:hypothetical protein LguiB_007434 [Lonicera macranthoides]
MKIMSVFLSKLFRILIWSWNIMLTLPRCGTHKLLSLYAIAGSTRGSAENCTILDNEGVVHLSSEIFSIILSWVPVKSILRFKTVCKEWRFLIQDPYFVSLQLSRTTCRPSRIVLLKMSPNKLMLVDSEGCKVGEIHITEEWWHIMGSYNGMLCVGMSGELNPVQIWNPMINEHIDLPISNSDLPVIWHYLDIGFDPSTKKYKVVRVYIDFFETTVSKFEIITLGETSWRQLDTPYNMLEIGKGASIFLDGFFYWVITNEDGPSWDTIQILSLDIANENFQTVSVPHNETFPVGQALWINWNLLNLGGVLYLTALDQHCIGKTEAQHRYQLMHAWQLMRSKVEGLHIRYLHTYNLHTSGSSSYNSLLGKGSNDSYLFKTFTRFDSVSKLVLYFTKTEDHLDLDIPLNYWQTSTPFEPSLISPGEALLGLQ